VVAAAVAFLLAGFVADNEVDDVVGRDDACERIGIVDDREPGDAVLPQAVDRLANRGCRRLRDHLVGVDLGDGQCVEIFEDGFKNRVGRDDAIEGFAAEHRRDVDIAFDQQPGGLADILVVVDARCGGHQH